MTQPRLRKPRLLDMYCKAGGAARGYQLAGFHVTGVDIKPQPRYAGDAFIQGDVLGLDPVWIALNFDAVHASPECQGYTALRHAKGAIGRPKMIGPTRQLLEEIGLPYTIENVEEARWDMVDPICLCGSMFGLGAQGHQLQRHRLFECSWDVGPAPPCRHDPALPVIGVYGGHARNRSSKHGGRGTKDQWEGGHRAAASEALGIDWMTLDELSEAIPPAYTRWLGERMLAQLGL